MTKGKKKIRLPKKSLIAEFLENQPKQSESRKETSVPVKQYFLIVCEGEKTEPNYFNSLKNYLPEHLANVVIFGEGKNTVEVVIAAIQKRDERKQNKLLPDFDAVYAVFDKDDFPKELFNKAVELARNNRVHPTYSNEAFELWYVLHFQYLDTPITRREYQETLKNILGKYEKNSKEMYSILQDQGDETQAVKWAEKLLEEKFCGNPSEEKPTTRVHELVSRLNEFKE